MLPRQVLADPARRAALIAMLLFRPVVAGYVYFTSLYNQDVLHFSPLQAGLAFIPATATVMLTATQLTRRILSRFGVRTILLAGLTITGLGQVWLHTISNTPGQVNFTPDGSQLLVGTKDNGSDIDVFAVDQWGGRTCGPPAVPSHGASPSAAAVSICSPLRSPRTRNPQCTIRDVW